MRWNGNSCNCQRPGSNFAMFYKEFRLLVLFSFPDMDAELRKTKQEAQSSLILQSGDEMQKKVWESLGRTWPFATSQDLDEHSWGSKGFLS